MSLIYPEIIAHRGASHDAPENTLAAFKLAWLQGADGIEGDFRLTKDGRIACIHDATTKRTAGVNITVAKSIFSRLRALDVGSWKNKKWGKERIPAFEEIFSCIPEGKKVFIEIKCGVEIIAPLKDAIAISGLKPRQTVVMSFNEAVIFETRMQLPRIKALWLTNFARDKNTGEWGPSIDRIVKTLKKIKADGLNCIGHQIIDEAFVKTLRKNKMELHVWNVNDIETAVYFRHLGVDSMTTDRPGWLRDILDAD
ncbi:MAG: glycerophosphodiester phosphodiesterase [Nitrospirae bacterium]|nr:glycerophosphodiester phosphodiesterase [Nitrospirota bacterium]